MIGQVLLAAFLAVVSAFSFASDRTIFSCKTSSGKQILVKESVRDYQYSFGRHGKPELVFQNTKREVAKQTESWDGKSRYIWDVMKFENGGTAYVVYKLIGTWQGESLNQGGVLVLSDGEEIDVECATPVKSNIHNR